MRCQNTSGKFISQHLEEEYSSHPFISKAKERYRSQLQTAALQDSGENPQGLTLTIS